MSSMLKNLSQQGNHMINSIPLSKRYGILSGFFYSLSMVLCVLGLVGLMSMNDFSGAAILFSFLLGTSFGLCAGFSD